MVTATYAYILLSKACNISLSQTVEMEKYTQLFVPDCTTDLLTLRWLMSYIYMEHPFLMFLDHTQRRSTVGRTPQLVAETSTWQHTTLTTDKYPCPRWDSNPRSQQASGPAARQLRSWVRTPPGAYLSVVSVVCCQVEVSATSWSLFQRSPTDCAASFVWSRNIKNGCSIYMWH